MVAATMGVAETGMTAGEMPIGAIVVMGGEPRGRRDRLNLEEQPDLGSATPEHPTAEGDRR